MNEQERRDAERPEEQAFDQVLRSVMAWQAPPELTERLVGLVATAAASPAVPAAVNMADAPVSPHPGRWYSILVMLLTAMAVGVSFAVAWQFYGIIGAELGLNEAWNNLQIWAAIHIQHLYQKMPLLQSLMNTIATLYERASWLLSWLLLAIVLWLAFDNQASSGAEMQQQQSS